MSNAYYRLYIESVMSLAKTMIIKSESTADAINLGLAEKGVTVDLESPSTWKYYINLSGRYHSTDVEMRVTSLDTLEDIPFTIESLALHRSTLRGYAYGTRFYNELVLKYPEQEQLILGILNPIPLSTTVDALDGKILYVDPDLIEENETTLVAKLQAKVDGFLLRWNVADYSKVDDLYTACHIAILYMNIPLFILQARLENCRTEEVHSFHIQQYLASNGRLDTYLTHLSKKQMLFLYRNIRYLHRNAGKQDTFEWLVDRILTDRLLPLAEYDFVHNVGNQPEDIYPTVELKRLDLTKYGSGSTKSVFTVREVIHKEQLAARGNAAVEDEQIAIVTEQMQTSIHNQLRTKVLESSVVDRTSAYMLKFSDVVLNHWVYLSSRDLYPTIISIDNPKTGELMWLNVKDAFVLYLYAYNLSIGVEIPTVPKVMASLVRKVYPPTKAELRKLCQPQYVPDNIIDYTLDTLVPVTRVISTDGFYELCRKIHNQWFDHRDLIALREHHVERGQTESMVYHTYQDYECTIGSEIPYDQWLSDNNLDLSDYSKAELELLWVTLLATATGSNLHVSYSVTELQQSMLKLMRQLSSYTVQFLDEVRGAEMWVTDWAAIRVGDSNATGEGLYKVHNSNIYVQNLSGTGRDVDIVDLSEITYDVNTTSKEFNRIQFDGLLDYAAISRGHDRIQVNGPTVYATLPPIRLLELADVITVRDFPDYEYPDTPPSDLTH